MDTTQLLQLFGPLILMMVIFYFMLIKPQKKKEAEIKNMRSNIKVGDDIITIGGIIGKVVLIKEDYLVIESSSMKSRIDLMKWGVSSVIENKKDLKS